jgi:hypothetical protein
MNWMSKHKGHIDCERKAIRITSSEHVEVEHMSTLPSSKVLCNKSFVEPSLKQVLVVKEYPCFSQRVSRYAPDRDIEL